MHSADSWTLCRRDIQIAVICPQSIWTLNTHVAREGCCGNINIVIFPQLSTGHLQGPLESFADTSSKICDAWRRAPPHSGKLTLTDGVGQRGLVAFSNLSCYVNSRLLFDTGAHQVKPTQTKLQKQREVCKGEAAGQKRRAFWQRGLLG